MRKLRFLGVDLVNIIFRVSREVKDILKFGFKYCYSFYVILYVFNSIFNILFISYFEMLIF